MGEEARRPDRPHPGRTPHLPHDQEVRFLERIDSPPRPDDGTCELRGTEIRRILEQEFAARYSLSGVYKLLHRLGYNDLMPRPQHPDSSPEAQEFFREIVVEHIEAIAAAHPDEVIQVWHQDEARFGQQGTLTRVWARRGSRPRRVRQNGRESLYVLTATCAASGAAFGLIMPELDTAVVNQFLEEFSRHLAPGVRAVLVWDNAPYHVGGGVVVPANVSPIGLLPYAPELNPVENLWHYLRSHYWSLQVYRADSFPTRWTHAHTLLSGGVFSDATLFQHDDRWWLFTETSEPRRHDTLRLFHADEPFGAWMEHPSSPIVSGDRTTARPAGRVVRTNAGFVRFAQVCAPRYGTSVKAFGITELTTSTYAERALSDAPVLAGSGVAGADHGAEISRHQHVRHGVGCHRMHRLRATERSEGNQCQLG